jgi:hypothetical protein
LPVGGARESVEAMGFEGARGRGLRSRLYVGWVYVKSVFYSLKRALKRNKGSDRFIYK